MNMMVDEYKEPIMIPPYEEFREEITFIRQISDIEDSFKFISKMKESCHVFFVKIESNCPQFLLTIKGIRKIPFKME